MPQVHTYIRNEDMEKWKSLDNKSEFIHNALSKINTVDTIFPGNQRLQPPAPIEQSVLDSLPVTPACCLKKSPCKHWIWQGEQMAYVNSISGEIREVDV